MDEHDVKAATFVTRFVEKHVKTRVLDGRPDKVLVQTLTEELASYLRQCGNSQTQERKRGRPRQNAGC